MSQRFSHNTYKQQDGNSSKYVPKTQKKFVPKSQNPDRNPPSLSSSLRQSDATAVSTSSAGTSGSRVRMGDSGDWVPIRTPARTAGNFVNYLPQDDAVALGLPAEGGGIDPVESQRVVDLLNRELSRLLKLNPREFWGEVARDTSLHEFLDSFLKFRSRWHDFPHHGAKGIVAGVIVGEFDLSRRVFMTLYRISSNKDPGARASDSLSLKDHAVLLQEKKLLDLPKLLDICAIYGHENEDLTRVLVENALRAQPWVLENLTAVLSHFLHIIQTMHQRCSSSLEALFSSQRHENGGSSQVHSDFLEVMDFINDAIVSLDAFVTAYKPAAVFFSCPVETSYGNEELLSNLVRLHDSLLPSLQCGFQIIFMAGENGTLSDIAINSKMLSMRILSFGWKLLDLCYLSNEMFKDGVPVPAVTKMFPAKVEDPIIRADILVQTFREVSGVSTHGHDNQNRDTFLQNIELNYNLTSKLRSLQNTGWIVMDDEQFNYISCIMTPSHKGSNSKESILLPASVSSNQVVMDEDAAVLESKISQIKDLFPDYGKGFLVACLEVYNQNPEEVIQRILEGTLHEDLQLLDPSLETLPVPKSASAVSKKEKGKEKLIETSVISDNKPVAAYAKQHPEGPLVLSSSSSSMTGRYIRKSKGDLPDHITLDSRNEEDTVKAAALISQYEYEDEYDDSFDDLGLSVGESGLEDNEILSGRRHSNFGAENESSSQAASASKWGTKKNPQYYVKDGKNYSYKVVGSVAVANANEAALVTQAQKDLIHGLGRGGNLPLGAVKKLTDYEEQNNKLDVSEMEGRDNTRTPRGRGRRGRGKPGEFSAPSDQDNQFDASEMDGRANMGNLTGWGRREGGKQRESSTSGDQDSQSDPSEADGKGNMGNPRGRGRRGGGGGGRNHHRKDRAMKKHFSGLTGF